jgi:hypothetical protein
MSFINNLLTTDSNSYDFSDFEQQPRKKQKTEETTDDFINGFFDKVKTEITTAPLAIEAEPIDAEVILYKNADETLEKFHQVFTFSVQESALKKLLSNTKNLIDANVKAHLLSIPMSNKPKKQHEIQIRYLFELLKNQKSFSSSKLNFEKSAADSIKNRLKSHIIDKFNIPEFKQIFKKELLDLFDSSRSQKFDAFIKSVREI